MASDPLLALSPLDGRYAARTAALAAIFSESGLMRQRVHVEVEWLVALSSASGIAGLPPLDEAARGRLRTLVRGFGLDAARRIISPESETERASAHDCRHIIPRLQRLSPDLFPRHWSQS